MSFISFFLPFLFLMGSCLLVILTSISYNDFNTFFNHFSFDLKQFYPNETHIAAQRIAFWLAGVYAFFALISGVFCRTISTYLSSFRDDACSFFKDLSRVLLKYWNELSLFEKFLLVSLFLLGIGIRLIYVNQPLRGDEGIAFYSFAQYPWYVILSAYNNVGNHIFHTLLMHVSCELFGDSLWAIRLPVIFSGIALLPLSFIVVRALSQKYTALLSTALISSSSALIEYSVNSRGYMVQILLMVALVGVAKYLITHRNVLATILFVLIASLAFWTVPTTFYIYGGICIWFFGNRLQFVPFKNNLVFLILINFFILTTCLILYTPIFLANSGIGHMNAMMSAQIQGNLSYSYFIQDLFKIWTHLWPETFQAFSLIGIISAFWFSLFEYKPSSLFQKKEFLILPCVLWAFFTSFFIFNPATRLWLVFAWVFYLSIAQGLWKILPRRFAPFIFTFLTITWAGLAVFNEYTHQFVYKNSFDAFQDANKTALYLKNNLQPHDLIYAASPTTMPLRYELEKLGIKTFQIDIRKTPSHSPVGYLSLSKDIQPHSFSQRIWIILPKEGVDLYTVIPKLRSSSNNPHLMQRFNTGVLYLLPNPT